MGYEKSEKAPSIREMCSFICNYREYYANRPIDYDWLIKRPINVIYGIYYGCLREYQSRQVEAANAAHYVETNNQLTFDDVFPNEGLLGTKTVNDYAVVNQEELSEEEIQELLALSHEMSYDFNNDYYDEYGHRLSDAQRMERRENAKYNRGISRILNK